MCIRDRADVQYAAAARAVNKGDMEECLEQFVRAIHSPVSYTHLDVYKRQP